MKSKNKEEELLKENQELKEYTKYLKTELEHKEKICTLDYEKEYYSQQEKINQLMTENEKLKIALINMALKL